MLREVLGTTSFMDDARGLARVLRRPAASPGSLLLVGTETHEPWHLTAHLDDEARYSGMPELTPTLVRWQAPAGAPRHLAVTLERLEAARRGETLFVVAPDTASEPLLTRAADARRRGATLLSLDGGDTELGGLVHERMVVSPSGLLVPPEALEGEDADTDVGLDFDVAQHLVSAAAGEPAATPSGWRARLDQLLDRISGPPPAR
jgi:hypothetical protein